MYVVSWRFALNHPYLRNEFIPFRRHVLLRKTWPYFHFYDDGFSFLGMEKENLWSFRFYGTEFWWKLDFFIAHFRYICYNSASRSMLCILHYSSIPYSPLQGDEIYMKFFSCHQFLGRKILRTIQKFNLFLGAIKHLCNPWSFGNPF